MGATDTLVKFINKTQLSDISQEAIDITKKHIDNGNLDFPYEIMETHGIDTFVSRFERSYFKCLS